MCKITPGTIVGSFVSSSYGVERLAREPSDNLTGGMEVEDKLEQPTDANVARDEAWYHVGNCVTQLLRHM
jgi:hypothetical protein